MFFGICCGVVEKLTTSSGILLRAFYLLVFQISKYFETSCKFFTKSKALSYILSARATQDPSEVEMRKTQCNQGCGQWIVDWDLAAYKAERCPKRPVVCPLDGKTVLADELEHYMSPGLRFHLSSHNFCA